MARDASQKRKEQRIVVLFTPGLQIGKGAFPTESTNSRDGRQESLFPVQLGIEQTVGLPRVDSSLRPSATPLRVELATPTRSCWGAWRRCRRRRGSRRALR